jgi:hypothetical protein
VEETRLRRWLARLWAWVRRHRIWTYPPLGWIAYLPIAATFVAALAVVLGAGRVVGAPSLIWHDQSWTQLLAGFALAMFAAHLGSVGYLLDSRENTNHVVAPEVATLRTVARYLLWPLDTLMLAVAWGFRHHGNGLERAHGEYVLVGPLVVTAIVVAVGWLPRGPKALIDLFPKRVHRHLQEAAERGHALTAARGTTAPAPDPGAHAVQAVIVLILLLFYCFAWRDDRVPAAVAVSLALSLVISGWGFLRFWARRYRLFWAAILIVVVCWRAKVGDLPVTGLSDVRFPSGDRPPRSLIADKAALDHWKSRFQGPPPRLVVVATSGGALRAALWTLDVLRDIERRIPGFLRHVRVVTGASGGMVGAAHLVSALNERGSTFTDINEGWFDSVIDDVAIDSLTPVTRALILPNRDRGRALEESWENHKQSHLEKKFRALSAGEEAGWLPSLIYSPMLVEDGRRLLISNLDLGLVARTPSPGPSGPRLASVSAVELFACAGGGIDDIKLSTVARLNATYPWVTSAARLTTPEDRRVVDAGYYDNYGVDVATAWIRNNAEWIAKNTSGVLLLQIRDETTARTNVAAEPGPGQVHEWFSALSTPVEAFFAARSASMSFRNDQKIEVLADNPWFERPGFFLTETFELKNKEPLEWYLDRATIADLKKAPPDPGALDEIYTWWNGRVP